jgi:hypothetical protein
LKDIGYDNPLQSGHLAQLSLFEEFHVAHSPHHVLRLLHNRASPSRIGPDPAGNDEIVSAIGLYGPVNRFTGQLSKTFEIAYSSWPTSSG